MDGRAGLVIGSLSAAAASVAVLSAVALTNTAALADTAGTDVYSSGIVVPASPTPSSAATPAAVAPVVQTPVEEVPPAQVVDTPPPVFVGDDIGPIGGGALVSESAAIAAATASGSRDALRAFGAARGWSAERTEAWIGRLVAAGRLPADRGDHAHHKEQGDRPSGPEAHEHAREDDPRPSSERRQDSPRPGHPGEKNRSSDSPVRGDR